jgi:hypothetical protein
MLLLCMSDTSMHALVVSAHCSGHLLGPPPDFFAAQWSMNTTTHQLPSADPSGGRDKPRPGPILCFNRSLSAAASLRHASGSCTCPQQPARTRRRAAAERLLLEHRRGCRPGLSPRLEGSAEDSL